MMSVASGTELVPRRVPIIGTEDEVAMVLRVQNSKRRLLTDPSTITPVRILSQPGYWRVDVDLLVRADLPAEPEPPAPAPVAPRSPWRSVLEGRRRMIRFGDRHPILMALLFVAGLFVAFLILATALLRALSDELVQAAWTAGGAMLLLVIVAAIVTPGKSGHSGHKGEGFHWSKCK